MDQVEDTAAAKKKKSWRGENNLWRREKNHNLYLIAVRVYYLSWK